MLYPELTAFPEEILERILSLCVITPLVQNARPQWHQRPNPASIRGRLACLLVCKKFSRICTPLFYHTIHVTSPAQLHRLLSSALRPNPYLATCVRRLLFAGIWAEGGELLSLCSNNVKMLDISLDVTQLAPGVNPNRGVRDLDAEDFCEGLKGISNSLTHLVLRKSNNVYLTQPKPKYVLGEVAKAMRDWDNLELADIAFRLSDDSGLGPMTANIHLLPIHQQANVRQPQGPITLLTHALITRPKLRTFCTFLPSLWNETILRVSTNPNLECIILGDGAYRPRETRTTSLIGNNYEGGVAYDAGNGGIAGTGLFMMQAKKHTRLSDLIRAGTSIVRTRAHTLGNASSPPSSPSTSSSRSPALPRISYVRSQSMIPMSSGPSPSSSSTSSVSSQKFRQQQNQNPHHHQPDTPKFDSAKLSRTSCGSGPSQPLSRSLVSPAV